MVNLVQPGIDLVTNVHPRTFPHGCSVEILRRRLFTEKEFFPQTYADREHVTPHLYRSPGLRILNHENPLGNQSDLAWSVEEAGDIERLEKLCPY
jgi:spore coat polysaccharide biosynthesis protein SpsF (cytidylyltransferase family)